MTWNDLLFMHWPIPESAIRSLVPPGLEIERFDGNAWIGVIPFHMSDVRPRGVPSLLASNFPETNVRTYVRHNGRSGVWFFSLDAASRLTVWGARTFFHLAYYYATMSVSSSQEIVGYRSRRAAVPDVELAGRYWPMGAVFRSIPGSLEHWLTERYSLFSADRRGRLFRGDIHHQPWPLQNAEAEIETNTMTRPLGITLPQEKPLMHFAKRLDVVAWSLESLSRDL